MNRFMVAQYTHSGFGTRDSGFGKALVIEYDSWRTALQ